MKVLIKTPSRIHLGFLDLRGDLGRIYGSVGFAIKYPYTLISIQDSDKLEIHSDDKRVFTYVKNIINYFKITPNFRVDVLKYIPAHVGLGSGTQLSLAVAYGISIYTGAQYSIEEAAKILGRGKRSGIGIYSFKYGGFIVDGGISKEGELPPLIFNYKFPEDWVIVIGIPNIERNIHGEYEVTLFNKLIARLKRESLVPCEASRILLMSMIPALIKKDIVSFGEAITRFEVEVGKMFSYVQGGIYRSPIIQKGIEFLLSNGAYGSGQSSWGPAFYGITDKDNYQKIADKLKSFLKSYGGGDIIVSSPNNEGAKALILE
ncbi:MAG TPA: GHMP kinase [Thermoprotei archaeon]|nr:GHMP kinase [Thermoprotei archaeon]